MVDLMGAQNLRKVQGIGADLLVTGGVVGVAIGGKISRLNDILAVAEGVATEGSRARTARSS